MESSLERSCLTEKLCPIIHPITETTPIYGSILFQRALGWILRPKASTRTLLIALTGRVSKLIRLLCPGCPILAIVTVLTPISSFTICLSTRMTANWDRTMTFELCHQYRPSVWNQKPIGVTLQSSVVLTKICLLSDLRRHAGTIWAKKQSCSTWPRIRFLSKISTNLKIRLSFRLFTIRW